MRPKKPVQRRDAYDEAKNKTTERREYKRIRAREERQRAKELGRCRSCPNPAIPDQTRCTTCAEAHRQSRRRSDARRRAAAKGEPAIASGGTTDRASQPDENGL